MGAKTVTAEEATEALVEERRTAMQATADQEAAADVAELERQNALLETKDKAASILEKRAELLPRFVESLAQVGELAADLRKLRDEYTHLGTRARKLGGSTETTWPRQFGVDAKERQLLRDAIEALSSVGGYV